MTLNVPAPLAISLLALALAPTARAQDGSEVRGWLRWRGPDQAGTSRETGLPDRLSSDAEGSWTYELSGRGTPVVADGRVYALGYRGEADQLQELLVCLDEGDGRLIWERAFSEFLTDTIYYRFSIGSPTIDPATGDVFWLTTSGLFNCFSRDGELRWQRALGAEFGRLTFPNGRTGAPLVDGPLAIVHVATSGWGPYGPGRDRFFAFEKSTGALVWQSTPGGPPKDGSFSFPVVEDVDGRRVMYAGLAGGHLVCVDVRTGEPLWRFQMSIGGMSSSPVLHGDSVIAAHGKENLDSSRIGRMVALDRGARPAPGAGQVVLGAEAERWRNDLVAFTSSPVLIGDRVYLTNSHGELNCVDAGSGEVLWHHKLAPDQIHASPAWGDGKLYVPMNNGSLHVVRPTDEGPEVLQSQQLEGNCLGAPAIANGRIYVHTTSRLYCFGGGTGVAAPDLAAPAATAAGAPTSLQVIPAELLLRQGDTAACRARSIDANGLVVADPAQELDWKGLPSGVTVDAEGVLRVAADAPPVATVFSAGAGELSGRARLRVVPSIPFAYDFDDVELRPTAAGAPTGRHPGWWVGAGKKWEVVELDGEKVLARAITNPLFQRTISLIGHPDMSGYTMSADIRTDGNRRTMSNGGVVNQRFLIQLKGNHQALEVSSNMELFKQSVPFEWKAKVWYRMKTRVEVAADGSGWVRAKVWQRDESEPDAWTIEVPHPHIHTHGSPGVAGFTPQSRFRVYLDNISVTAND